MGKRKNVTIETAERPKGTRELSALAKQRILELHDTRFTPLEIAREVDVPVTVVRQVLTEMCPVDKIYA